jgi:hypothetical protein
VPPTYLLLNAKFFSQFAARFNILVRKRRSVECTVCLLQLSTFNRTTRLYRKVNVAVWCSNENKWLNEVKFRFLAFVLKKIVAGSFDKYSRVYRVRKIPLSTPTKRKHVNTDERKTSRWVDRIRHRKMESYRLSHGPATNYPPLIHSV